MSLWCLWEGLPSLAELSSSRKTLWQAGIIFAFLALVAVAANRFGYTLCVFKRLTGVPCPTCGTTRGFKSILEGSLWEGFLWNPLGILGTLVALAIYGVKWWRPGRRIMPDAFWRYQGRYAFALVILILLNWIYVLRQGN